MCVKPSHRFNYGGRVAVSCKFHIAALGYLVLVIQTLQNAPFQLIINFHVGNCYFPSGSICIDSGVWRVRNLLLLLLIFLYSIT
jgi:hypothetical protein